MYELIQQVDHIKQKVQQAIKLYDDLQINKQELGYLLGRYLSTQQISDLLDRLGI